LSDRREGETGELELFDLPLAAPTANVESPAAPPTPALERPEHFEVQAEAPVSQQTIDLEGVQSALAAPPPIATFTQRILSGGADVLIHAGALATAALGLRMMAIEPRLGQWPALLIFLLAFSFLYTVVSLSFWGQTAGMAWFGLAARESPVFPISFSQALRRWLGGWITVALLGLPLVLLVWGSSLSDRMSHSRTYRAFLPAS
jgi:uncharacterized RDD family membrane protein YckC